MLLVGKNNSGFWLVLFLWNDKYWINLIFDVLDILLKDFIFLVFEE